jgi:hypothetical protein
MMTLKRFRRLAASYGADLRRWPERLRSQAGTFLESSMEAREIMADAKVLDEAIGAAGNARTERLWSGESDAALLRLRNSVAARIGAAGAPAAGAADEIPARRVPRSPGRARWIGLATAASLAILAGVVLGIVYSPSASRQDLLAVLQPEPIQLLNE